MISQQQLECHWDELKAALQKRWGHLTDEELHQTRGDRKLLLASLERRTGLARRDIEQFLADAVGGADSMMRQAADTASRYAARAADGMREQYDHLADGVHDGYEQAGEVVRGRPTESVAIAFAAGALTGLALSLILSKSQR